MSGELAAKDQSSKKLAEKMSIVAKVDAMLDSPTVDKTIKGILPKHANSEAFMQSVRLAVRRSQSKLAKCSPVSIINSIANAAEVGLTLSSSLGHAYLAPFKNECTFMPGYKGLVELSRRCADVEIVEAFEVYKDDSFKVKAGTDGRGIFHEMAFSNRTEENITHFYAIARFRGGDYQFAVMTRADVDAIMAGALKRSTGFSPWKTNFIEMGKKTVIKRLCKLLPMTAELAIAMEFDNDIEAGRKQRSVLDADVINVRKPEAEALPESIDSW